MKTVQKTAKKPRKARVAPASRRIGLSHPRHTGRLLPHASTSYPMLAMIVLVVGVLLGGWTHLVSADISANYVVTASVPAVAPTVAATLNSPSEGTHFTQKPILISGTCPILPGGGYVSVYRNMFYSGTAVCDVTGNYSLSIDLFDGANQLVARIFNFTDVAGPDSTPVNVVYDKPVVTPVPPPTSTSGSTSVNPTPATRGFSNNPGAQSYSGPANTLPLTLSSDFTIRGYYVGEETAWQFDIQGGVEPYAISIDWGDGSTGVLSRQERGIVKALHTYPKPGNYRGSYVVKVTVTDIAGNESYLQQLVIVNSRAPSAVSSALTLGGGGPGTGILQTLRNYILPSYGVTVLMVASFWLGELRHGKVRKYAKIHPKRVRHA